MLFLGLCLKLGILSWLTHHSASTPCPSTSTVCLITSPSSSANSASTSYNLLNLGSSLKWPVCWKLTLVSSFRCWGFATEKMFEISKIREGVGNGQPSLTVAPMKHKMCGLKDGCHNLISKQPTCRWSSSWLSAYKHDTGVILQSFEWYTVTWTANL